MLKNTIRSIIRRTGFDVVRTRTLEQLQRAQPVSQKKNYYYETDETFASIYREAVRRSRSAHDPGTIPQRLYNTTQFLNHALNLKGAVVECGCFGGLSSYVFCRYIRRRKPTFNGEGYHVFDSFQGLSAPTPEDAISRPEYGTPGESFGKAGDFCGSLADVKRTLSEFPLIIYHPGWIPDSFNGIEEKAYRFVHLDLDLYEPINEAIKYFYPRLVAGGVIVVDEYGFPRWPGARKAVDEFCALVHTTPIGLTTGNGIIIKH